MLLLLYYRNVIGEEKRFFAMKESLVEESLDCWNCVNYENRLIEDVPSSSWQIIVGRELDRRLF